MSGTVRFDFMHFMPYVHLPENHKDYKSLWVDFPNKYYDPKRGYELYQRYLAELLLADKVGFDAVVVNEHHNTSYSMMAAPSSDCRSDHSADQERQNLRVGHAAKSGISKSPRGRVRHARCHVAGPARSRVPARHRHGILGQSDQPGDGARAPSGIDRHYSASLDAGRPNHLLRRLLHVSLSQSVAAAVSEAVSALLHRRHRQPGDDRTRGQTRLRLLVGFRHQAARA